MKTSKFTWLTTLITTASALTVPVSAHAQSSVTLYGIVDTGVEYLTNANKTPHALVQLQDGNIQESRWGIRTREDLGDGWQASAWLEFGFDETKGTTAQGNRLFGRQAAAAEDDILGNVRQF
jgi:predicted porin